MWPTVPAGGSRRRPRRPTNRLAANTVHCETDRAILPDSPKTRRCRAFPDCFGPQCRHYLAKEHGHVRIGETTVAVIYEQEAARSNPLPELARHLLSPTARQFVAECIDRHVRVWVNPLYGARFNRSFSLRVGYRTDPRRAHPFESTPVIRGDCVVSAIWKYHPRWPARPTNSVISDRIPMRELAVFAH